MAIRLASGTYSVLGAGVRSYVRKIKPILKTFHYVSKKSTETEVLGYTEIIRISADRVSGDAANDYLFSLVQTVGTECKSEIFIYNTADVGSTQGSYIGKRYPVSIVVTSLCADENTETSFYGFEADIYINGEGITEERVV